MWKDDTAEINEDGDDNDKDICNKDLVPDEDIEEELDDCTNGEGGVGGEEGFLLYL